MSRILCLGGGVESTPIIRRVVELGHEPIVADYDARCAAREMGVMFVQASCYDGPAVIAALRSKDVRHLDAVLCCGVDAPVAAAQVAHEFGLPGLSDAGAARLSVDKYQQKVVLDKADLPVPHYLSVTEHDLNELFCDGRLVMKPLDSRGGRGVIRLVPQVGLRLAYEIAKQHSPSGRVIAEEWLDGPQYSTESIVQNGSVLFTAVAERNYDRLEELAPFVIEDGSDTPALLTSDALFTINWTIEQACAALGWYQHGGGTVKGDLVYHAGRWVIIELAARLSGGYFASHITPWAYGVDFVGAAINAALGYTLERPDPYHRAEVCQRFVFPAEKDLGKTVRDIQNVESHDERIFLSWNIRPGQIVERVTNHPARWGQVTVASKYVGKAKPMALEMTKLMHDAVVLS